ncbi:MAG: hypothetical protein O3B11_03655 [Bacteroidetes bacterium]|nr:hypothetical protein [Bacteroidota bacterium]
MPRTPAHRQIKLRESSSGDVGMGFARKVVFNARLIRTDQLVHGFVHDL